MATIVVAPDAPNGVTNAARTLCDLVEKSSGARPNVSESAPGEGTVIYIGDGPWVKDFDLNQTGLEKDGFEITFAGSESMLILGPSPWGTEFGVYDFLERCVGVRWLTPEDIGTHIPKHETIRVPVVAVREKAAFIDRSLYGLYPWKGNRDIPHQKARFSFTAPKA